MCHKNVHFKWAALSKEVLKLREYRREVKEQKVEWQGIRLVIDRWRGMPALTTTKSTKIKWKSRSIQCQLTSIRTKCTIKQMRKRSSRHELVLLRTSGSLQNQYLRHILWFTQNRRETSNRFIINREQGVNHARRRSNPLPRGGAVGVWGGLLWARSQHTEGLLSGRHQGVMGGNWVRRALGFVWI